MQIQCSHCSTLYEIDADKVPTGESFVRCSNCHKPILVKKGGDAPERVIAQCPACETQYAIPKTRFTDSVIQAHCGQCGEYFELDQAGQVSSIEPQKAVETQFAPETDEAGGLGGLEELEEEIELKEPIAVTDDFDELEDHEELGELEELEDHEELGELDDTFTEEDEAPFGAVPDIEDAEDLGELPDITGLEEDEETDSLGDFAEDAFAQEADGDANTEADHQYMESVHLGDEELGELGEELSLEDKSLFLSTDENSEFPDLDEELVLSASLSPQEEVQKSKKKNKKPSRGGYWKVAFFLCFLGLLGWGGYRYYDPLLYYQGRVLAKLNLQPKPSQPQRTPSRVPKLSILQPIEGKEIDNPHLKGKLFALQGTLKNLHAKDDLVRAVLLSGALYDKSNRKVSEAKAYAGKILSYRQLSTLSKKELLREQNNRARASEITLGRGFKRQLDFQILFFSPPKNIQKLEAMILTYQLNGKKIRVNSAP